MVVQAMQSELLAQICDVSRCAETGAFRFGFDIAGRQVRADLTVCWREERGLASLSLVEVDYVDADRATAQAVEAWVAANQDAVFAAALRCL